MTNSTRYFGLFLTAALLVSAASGQDMSSPEWDDDMPPDLSLPSAEVQSSPGMAVPHDGDQSMIMGSDQGAATPFDGYEEGGIDQFSPDLHGQWPGPAPIESTGTWLRRGFWYLETEGVIWNRMWNRDDKVMAADDEQVQDPNFFESLVSAPGVDRDFFTNRLLILSGAHPGQDGSVRGTLGHFIFRDARNRDHTAEFTAFGGGDWEQERVISSAENFGLFVPFYIDGVNRSFDQSTRQTIDYDSSYSSFELNYRVKQRLGRDQMVMDANGCWHRAANSGFEREYLVGLRFMELSDSLDWRAEDIQEGTSQDLGNDGVYLIDTDNDMFGFQMGTGLSYQAPRWSLGFNCKGGVFVNDATGQTTLDFTVDDDDDSSLYLKEDELSFVGEAKLLGRWHLTPSFSLRAAYELMYMESVALAPYQATFIPDFSFLNTTGDPFYHGASFGFEGYW